MSLVDEFGAQKDASVAVQPMCADIIQAVAGTSSLRIEKPFHVKMDLLLKMQGGYDTENMRLHADEIAVQRYASPAL
jgi:hypothetical protein